MHYLMGHCGARAVKHTVLKHIIQEGVAKFDEGCMCVGCQVGKATRKPRLTKHRTTVTNVPGGVVHLDTAGPFGDSLRGEKYAVVAVDEATGYTVVSVSRNKGSRSASMALKKMSELLSHHGYRLKVAHSDQGTEFKGEFEATCKAWGIEQTLSAKYVPQQNGRAERAWRRLGDIMGAMLSHAAMGGMEAMWVDAMMHAADIANTVWCERLGMSPRQRLLGDKDGTAIPESGEGFQTFGAKVIIYGPALEAQWRPSHKAHPKGVVGFYVGRGDTTKHVGRYLIPDLHGRAVYVETMHANSNESLLAGARVVMPRELAEWQKGANNYRAGATAAMMGRLQFGATGGELIDPRCRAEQVLVKIAGEASIVYEEEEDDADGRYGANAKDGGGDAFEPHLHMDIGRYFGEVHLGLHPGDEDKRLKGEGWYYGRVTSMWFGQQAEDKGVQYYRITYDDGDTEDLERGEVRKIIREHTKAMEETARLRDEDEEKRGDSGTHVVEKRDTASGGEKGKVDGPNTRSGPNASPNETVGMQRRRSNRLAKSKIARLSEDPRKGWARKLTGVERVGVGPDEVIRRVAEGEEFDEVAGQMRDNHFDNLELVDDEDTPVRCYETDGSSREIDFESATKDEKSRSMRMSRRSERCRRLCQMPKGTDGAREEAKMGALDCEFLMSGGLPRMDLDIDEVDLEHKPCTAEEAGYGDTKETKYVGGAKKGEQGLLARVANVWMHEHERSESIEDEDKQDDVHVVFRCTVKKTGQTVFVDEDAPPYRLAMQPSFPRHEMWKAAMTRELREQLDMDAFTVTERHLIPAGAKVLKSNWRLLLKRNARGEVERGKARGYLCGFAQIGGGIHYLDTTSPTVRPASLRTMLGHATKYNMETMSTDVSVAFLTAKMDYEIFFNVYDKSSLLVPDVIKKEGEVALANSAIYGCKQGSRQFWKLLSKTLYDLGFRVSRGDACLWSRAIDRDGNLVENYDIRKQWDPTRTRADGRGTGERDGVRVVYAASFVDDILLTGSSDAALEEAFEGLKKTFRIKNLGEVESFLGCLITRSVEGDHHISQPPKCRKAALAAGVVGEKRKRVKVPSKGALRKPDTPREDMSKEDVDFVESVDYRAFVGLVLHIYVFTRPDIGYAVNQLASHSNDPRREHVEAVKQLGRYLEDTAELGIRYDGGHGKGVDVYCDADFADCVDTRRSISGFVVMMYGGATSWTCRKQVSVALSTMEAEAVAARVAFCEVIGLKWDAEVLDPQLGDESWVVHEDNQSLIAVIGQVDGGKYEARKHIAVRVMWLREVVATKIVQVKYVDTKEQTADVMTKALPAKEFAKHRRAMLNIDDEGWEEVVDDGAGGGALKAGEEKADGADLKGVLGIMAAPKDGGALCGENTAIV